MARAASGFSGASSYLTETEWLGHVRGGHLVSFSGKLLPATLVRTLEEKMNDVHEGSEIRQVPVKVHFGFGFVLTSGMVYDSEQQDCLSATCELCTMVPNKIRIDDRSLTDNLLESVIPRHLQDLPALLQTGEQGILRRILEALCQYLISDTERYETCKNALRLFILSEVMTRPVRFLATDDILEALGGHRDQRQAWLRSCTVRTTIKDRIRQVMQQLAKTVLSEFSAILQSQKHKDHWIDGIIIVLLLILSINPTQGSLADAARANRCPQHAEEIKREMGSLENIAAELHSAFRSVYPTNKSFRMQSKEGQKFIDRLSALEREIQSTTPMSRYQLLDLSMNDFISQNVVRLLDNYMVFPPAACSRL
ncbi:hypothetical protein AJ80_09996 [Polytolypa hystricis UAMH7299]|uniref:Uncharacterized protein n=1 Tax=Polytolypa hystricis (strain UAMH7299) TaxID=1447883 RepID=A0A2B7WF82_POLH7|nr:hypothetical protein AJ80_09996 [Polytolypa hystricis UAMH7299]